MREEELRVVARAEIDAFDVCDAGRAKRAFRGRPEVELAVDGQIVVE